MRAFDIGFDLDEVLMDCVDPLLMAAKTRGWISHSIQRKDVLCMPLSNQYPQIKEDDILNIQFFEDQMPYPHVYYDILNWKLQGVKICFVTSRKYDIRKTTYLKLKELNLYVGDDNMYGNIFFSKTREKVEIIEELGLLSFVDDDPRALIPLAGKIPFVGCVAHAYNASINGIDGIFHNSWDEISSRINELLVLNNIIKVEKTNDEEEF